MLETSELLHGIPPSFDDQIQNTDIAEFINRIHDQPVALTVGNFIFLTREFIVTVSDCLPVCLSDHIFVVRR